MKQAIKREPVLRKKAMATKWHISLAVLLLCCLLLCGCTARQAPAQKQYTATFLSLFDTVTTVVGRAESQAAFEEAVQPLREELDRYHKLFDIYNEYEGLVNLKTVNDKAGIAPVKVDRELLELLRDCKAYAAATNGLFNPAMGSVLRLWHEAREDGRNDPQNAYLPEKTALQQAAQHMNPEDILLDFENSTVYFTDPEIKLDVGAIAKGWAVQKVCENAPGGLLLSVGGNVCATGPKYADGTPWAVGIQNPDGSDKYLHILNIQKGSVVTSGSYQRAYTVDGKPYHHIIDPATLYPGTHWVSVTVAAEDSGLADVLSTALFLLDYQQGQALLEAFDAHAMWVDSHNNQYYSPGFQALIRN